MQFSEMKDWQANKTPAECIEYLLDSGEFSDLVFEVGEERQIINAHKLVLAMRSPVFGTMFYGGWSVNDKPIFIPDVTPEAFRAFLRYCYTQRSDVSEQDALGTLYAAKKYILPQLEEKIRKFMIKSLSPTTIWEWYTWSIVHDDQLHKVCQAFFTKNVNNTSSALKSPAFLDVPKGTLLDLLQARKEGSKQQGEVKYDILVAEVELFQACNAWAKAECLRQKMEFTGTNKRTVLADCLALIRFPSMLAEDIIRLVSPTELLTPEEMCRLLEQQQADGNTPVTPCLVVPPSNQTFIVSLGTDSVKEEMMEEFSELHQQIMNYSSILLKPKVRFLLSGIWVEEDGFEHGDLEQSCPHDHNCGFVEVLIIEMGVVDKACRVLQVRPEKGLADHHTPHGLVHLPLDDVHLKAGCTYEIRVESNLLPLENYGLRNNRFSYNVMEPDDIDLEITGNSANEHIVGLSVRLV